MPRKITLSDEWEIGTIIGSGGFGKVYNAKGKKSDEAVAKFVPKTPGATREQLFVDIGGAVNVIPVLDHGETDDSWVIVMPKAKKSLRELMDADSEIDKEHTVNILSDIAEALISIDGKVVHRDIKPENILFLNGKWCLADFGISRYAEASTAPDTQKYAWTPAYAAPERWRAEHADIKVDIYAIGVIAYELLTGRKPFEGPSTEEYGEQHLHQTPNPLSDIKPSLAGLVNECLFKPAGTRPQPAQLLARLKALTSSNTVIEIPELQQANRSEVERISEEEASRSRAKTLMDKREALFTNAFEQLVKLSNNLADAILENASTATISNRVNSSWVLRLGKAKVQFSPITRELFPDWEGRKPNFDVIATADLSVTSEPDKYGYEGRAHSLWFCDFETKGEYAWYEGAFMVSVFIQERNDKEPFALTPGGDAGAALSNAMTHRQVAMPFKKISAESLPQFIQWWATYLAKSSIDGCHMPTTMPEPPTSNGWR